MNQQDHQALQTLLKQALAPVTDTELVRDLWPEMLRKLDRQAARVPWFDWTLVAKHADVHRFVKMLNARRLFRDLNPAQQSLCLNEILLRANKTWHGVKPGQPDWGDSSHSLAISAESTNKELLFYVILNAYWEALEFELPRAGDGDGNSWLRWVDTSLDSPLDIVDWEAAPTIPGSVYRAGPRSMVVLFAHVGDGTRPNLT